MTAKTNNLPGPPTRIAVSTDLSEASRASFGLAASLARNFETPLFVVYRSEFPRARERALLAGAAAYEIDSLDSYQDDEEAQLKELVASEPAFAGIKVENRFLRDVQTDAYSRFLEDEGIDLLVLATHGRSGLRRLVMGSFAERAIRTAHCPVLVVRCDRTERLEGYRPSRMLVPTDFSDCSVPAAGVARAWTRQLGASVRLLHVVLHDPGVFGYARDVAESWFEFYKNARFECSTRLEKTIEEEWEGLDVDYQITSGMPGDAIVSEADETGADLIVMGTHGRSGFEHFLMGSVAEATLRRAPCPILIVPAACVSPTAGREPVTRTSQHHE